jgi:hypothetical protein
MHMAPQRLRLTRAEKNLRVQIPHRVPIARARVRLPKVPRDRREDQQDQMVSPSECLSLPAFHKRQDDQALEGV